MDSNPNSAAMIQIARNLRMEKDREQKISQQRMDLRNSVSKLQIITYFKQILMISFNKLQVAGISKKNTKLKTCQYCCLKTRC